MKFKPGYYVLAVLLALMLVGGCPGIQKAGQDVEEFICSPPANVVSLVNMGEPFIVATLSMAVPGSVPYLQAFEAYGGMMAIQAGACATVKQVNALIALLSGISAKTLYVKALSPAFDVTPLKDWLATARKK